MLGAGLAGCTTSGAVRARSPEQPTPPPQTRSTKSVLTGMASWYGSAHHGRRTASGEIYDMNQLTAAHPTLSMGTRLLVTNLNNGRSVRVRVNDRGPTIDGRILDLSLAAAKALGGVGDGVIPVRVEVLSRP